jgi:hypothetical protein
LYESLENYSVFILGGIGLALAVTIVILTRKNRKISQDIIKTETKDEKATIEKKTIEPTMSVKPVFTTSAIEKIKSELRIMDVEKEIIGYALTRLYETEAEGRLNEKDREMLLGKYKDEMKTIDRDIEKKQMIVKLHDLEKTKTDLIEMFNTKLDEISRNIENMKSTLGIPAAEPPTIKAPTLQLAEKIPVKDKKEEEVKTAPKVREKSKAEEKIEAIQEEVLKVLERLEQIETEK